MTYEEYLNTPHRKAIADKRMEIDGHQCVMCGSRGTKANPLEVHHLSYKHLYHEEERIYEDLVTLCHADHKAVHNLMCRVTDRSGRRGWKDRYDIPKVSIYTISGNDINTKEMEKYEPGKAQ